MTKALGETGVRIHESKIRLPYTWWVGETGSRFYAALKENCRLWGTKCSECKMVSVPPKKNCPKCFSSMNEWVELPGTGSLLTYTVVRYSVPNIQPEKPPYALGIIKLDGADTGMTHMVGDIDLDHIEVGMRVQAVFREIREGNYKDIKYFRPL
jgi:uncharacterized OB-fold protein